MNRKLAILTVLGALLALAIPASASASISPASTKFEIQSISAGAPKLHTSLGWCELKITGETPKSPENLGTNVIFGIPKPTVTNCSSGASATLSGEWKVVAGGYIFSPFSSAGSESIVMRFSSLPSCKLTLGAILNGQWNNGVVSPALKSGFTAFVTRPATWANDSGTCALAGKTEPATFLTGSKSATNEQIGTLAVNNLTSPTTPIIVGN